VAGTGYEQTEAAANIPTILLLTFITVPMYLTTLLACKLSMLAFYLRVFQKQSLRVYVFVTMGLCVLWFISHFLANVFICSPVEAQWKIELIMSGQGTCGNQIPIFQSMIITNMLTDMIIMILPISECSHVLFETIGSTACQVHTDQCRIVTQRPSWACKCASPKSSAC
jgi:hypothetical protein